MREAAGAPIAVALAALGGWLRGNPLQLLDQRAAIIDAALRLHDREVETLLAYWLDAGWRLLQVDEIAVGSEREAAFSLRYLARCAIATDARAAIVVHNHPNGDPTPSDADRHAADRTDAYLSFIGVPVLGHHVVARGGFGCIRTGVVERFETMAAESTPVPDSRCPQCNQLLEETT